MFRLLTTALAAVLAMFAATPAAAQDKTEPGSEPVERIYSLYVSGYEVIVDGEEATAIPAGSEARIRLTLTNAGDERARDVSLVLHPESPSIEVLDGRASLGDIAAGDDAEANFRVRVNEEDCSPEGALRLRISSSLGERDDYVGSQVLCPGPLLYPGEVRYVGGDDDGVPEPGERLRVFVTLYNSGRDAATNVSARARIENADVTLVDDEASWPSIAAGESAEASDPFVIEIANDAEVTQGCGPYTIEPVEDGDRPVSSHGGQDDAPAPDGGDGGGSTPSEGEAEPMPEQLAVEDAPPPGDERAAQEQDPAATFEASMVLTASGEEFESGFGSYEFCALAADGGAEDSAARDLGAPVAADGEASGGGSPNPAGVAVAVALIAAVGGGLLLRRTLLGG